jgi:hypothetical protein
VTRAVLQFQAWSVAPDEEPDAEPITFGAQCAVCLRTSSRSTLQQDVADWVRDHAARNPSHHSYRELIQRPLRAWMPHTVNP